MKRETIASLNCIVTSADRHPAIPVVILHGFGASASDLGDLPVYWRRILGDSGDGFEFVVPDAPMKLDHLGIPGGRAWWPINMSRLMELVEAEQFEELHVHRPPGIDEATASVIATIRQVREDAAESWERPADEVPYVLGGFSQGAMLAANIALTGDITPPALLLEYSGTLICQPQWFESLDRLSQTTVYQTHGTLDPVLPFASAETLGEKLRSASRDYDFYAFEGGHGIPPEVISKSAKLLQETAANINRG